MRIVYLVEGTETWGGVKVVLEHANGLIRLGHTVVVLSKGPPPTWFPLRAAFRQVSAFTADVIPPADYVIGTYWTTVPPAVETERGVPVHFCQGYEGDFYPEDEAIVKQIEATYRLPALKVTCGQLCPAGGGRGPGGGPPPALRLHHPHVPDEEATPGAIIAIQPFGEMLNVPPHEKFPLTSSAPRRNLPKRKFQSINAPIVGPVQPRQRLWSPP